MTHKLPAALFALLITILIGSSLRADLVPGDIALTRIDGTRVSIMALKDIPSGEVIRMTNRRWTYGRFDSKRPGGTGSITISKALQPGDQLVVDVSEFKFSFDWGDSLHFFQVVTPPFAPEGYIRHLLLVELQRDGRRLITNVPDGLTNDVTHIVLRQQFPEQGMDHIIRESFLEASLSPFRWLNALGSFRAWTFFEDYSSPISIGEWAGLSLTVEEHPGMISFPFRAQNFKAIDGQIFVPVRRSFGSEGNVTAELLGTDSVEPFQRWDNETVLDYNQDLTGVAFGPGVGFVAVSPKTGRILIKKDPAASFWDVYETNEDSKLNLSLSSIMHDNKAFWACSTEGRIFKSEDGINWVPVFDTGNKDNDFFRIFFLPDANFPYIAVGKNSLLAFSQDGEEWALASLPFTADLFGATYFKGDYVLCGANGIIAYGRSLLEGAWSPSSTPTTRTLFSIKTVGGEKDDVLLAVGQHGTMLESSAPKSGFNVIESNTKQSLFDLIEVNLNANESTYLFAVGANGATTISRNFSGFITQRLDRRAPALYALAEADNGKTHDVYAVGEYGSIVRFDPTESSLSGSLSGVLLDGNSSNRTPILWESGECGEQYVKVDKTSTVSKFRERIDLQLRRPAEFGAPYRLGNKNTQINFFRSISGRTPAVDNFGPFVYMIVDPRPEIINDAEWRLNFSLLNSSDVASNPLFIRFEGTNLPDFKIPPSATKAPGSRLAPLERTGEIEYPLTQPVQTIALYEEFRDGENVLKGRAAINSLAANPEWSPVGFFPRSLGIYLDDNGNLDDSPGIPGIIDNQSTVPPSDNK